MPRWQNLRGVFDNESMTLLLGAYRMENLLDSYVSDTNSEGGSVVLALSAKVARKTNIMDRNVNAAEIVVVDVDQELEHVHEFICGCRCFDDGPCCRQFADWEIFISLNERKGDDSQTVCYTSSIDCFAVVACSASLIVTLSSLTITCHDSHKPVTILLV